MNKYEKYGQPIVNHLCTLIDVIKALHFEPLFDNRITGQLGLYHIKFELIRLYQSL